MHPVQKALTTAMWALVVVLMFAIVGYQLYRTPASDEFPLTEPDEAAIPLPERSLEGDPLGHAPVFDLRLLTTDGEQGRLTRAQMDGQVWGVLVFFSECPGICPEMARKVAGVVEPNLGDAAVPIVAIALDEVNDTPENVLAFAEQHGATSDRWRFLLGSADEVMPVAQSYGLMPPNKRELLYHSGKLLLVDHEGEIRGKYEHRFDEHMRQFAADALALRSVAEQQD